MMLLEHSERRSAVSSTTRLLTREAWRASEHGTALRGVIAAALDSEDRLLRYYAAGGIRHIADSDSAVLGLIRDRLIVEDEPEVAAVLVHQLRCLAIDNAGDVD